MVRAPVTDARKPIAGSWAIPETCPSGEDISLTSVGLARTGLSEHPRVCGDDDWASGLEVLTKREFWSSVHCVG